MTPRESSGTPDVRHIHGPESPTRLGVVVPYDMALDYELARWTPADVSLHFTRTPFAALPVSLEMAETVSDTLLVAQAVQDLKIIDPECFLYGCTSGSFVNGVAGEQLLVRTMSETGEAPSVTTSGALLQAIHHLGVRRVSIATPYDAEITDRLASFLAESAIDVVGSSYLGLDTKIWSVPYARTAELILDSDHGDAEAIVVSCTNLPTYDLIAPLEQALGKPVLSANQATVWAALRILGRTAIGPGQRLIDHGLVGHAPLRAFS